MSSFKYRGYMPFRGTTCSLKVQKCLNTKWVFLSALLHAIPGITWTSGQMGIMWSSFCYVRSARVPGPVPGQLSSARLLCGPDPVLGWEGSLVRWCSPGREGERRQGHFAVFVEGDVEKRWIMSSQLCFFSFSSLVLCAANVYLIRFLSLF